MKNIRQDIAVYVQLGGFFLIWVGLAALHGNAPQLDFDSLQLIPDAIAVYLLAYTVFRKWLWRWHRLQGWLIPFPDLQGTWRGELISSWVNPETGSTPEPIPAILVIRQEFDSIHVALHTRESSSWSMAATIRSGEEDGRCCLDYLYSNTPRATNRDRSKVHDGAATLRVLREPTRAIEGEYWTNRGTSGEMNFRTRSPNLADSFVDA